MKNMKNRDFIENWKMIFHNWTAPKIHVEPHLVGLRLGIVFVIVGTDN